MITLSGVANLLNIHSFHTRHTRHTRHTAHTAHTAHTTHTSHASHARHTPHTSHAAHCVFHVVVHNGLLTVLLVLIDPLGEIGLDVVRLLLRFLKAGPILLSLLLLTEDQGEGTRIQALRTFLMMARGSRSAAALDGRWREDTERGTRTSGTISANNSMSNSYSFSSSPLSALLR
jgi:hypothetical protein